MQNGSDSNPLPTVILDSIGLRMTIRALDNSSIQFHNKFNLLLTVDAFFYYVTFDIQGICYIIKLAIRLASEGLGVAFTMRSYVPAMTIHKPIRYFITGNTETAPILSICTLRNRSKEPLLRTCIRIIKRILTENKGD